VAIVPTSSTRYPQRLEVKIELEVNIGIEEGNIKDY